MEITGLQTGGLAQPLGSVSSNQGDGSAAAAFFALLEDTPPQGTLPSDEEIDPGAQREEADKIEQSEEEAESGAILPLLPMPELLARSPAPADADEAVSGGRAVKIVTGQAAELSRQQPFTGAVVGEISGEMLATPANLDSAEADEKAEATVATVPSKTTGSESSIAKQASPLVQIGFTRLDKQQGSMERDTAATNARDTEPPDTVRTNVTVDLPDVTAVTISVHEGKTDGAPTDFRTEVRTPHTLTETRHIMRQVAQKLADGPTGTVEIALSPEELGKVRLVIAPGEKPAVTVIADRPETHDLLRRNVDALDKELRSAGVFGADISFSGGNDPRNDQSNRPSSRALAFTENDQTTTFAEHAAPSRPRSAVDRLIDIRI